MLRAAFIVFLIALLPAHVRAQARIALLIGNEAYTSEIGRLANPHNDVALLEQALNGLGFEVVTVRDAGLGTLHQAVNAYGRRLQAAGANAVGFFYYSGHGASDGSTNYLIPVDVKTTETGELWDESLRLTEITRKLKAQAGNATHFVVFDACRNTLKLTRPGSRAVVQSKGFVPIAQENGMLIAYATAEGELASDIGTEAGPYAKVLAEEIVKPGVESVTMFRTVQLKVKQAIGQDPWLSFPTLPAVYFAGTKPAALTPEQQLELTFWLSVKDSTSPAVLATYIDRYPNGEFAAIARALAEHYDRKLKAEQAVQEEEHKRIEEERKTAEVKRLEEERRLREAAIAEERKRTAERKASEEARRLEEQQRAELVARTEELRKAAEDARLAREAAKAAEMQRLAAVKAAEDATRQAEEVIALKRETDKTATKMAALPKLPIPTAGLDGTWQITWRAVHGCRLNEGSYQFLIQKRVIHGRNRGGNISGEVLDSGTLQWTFASPIDGVPLKCRGIFHGDAGTGRCSRDDGRCVESLVAKRN
jgi:uncharacterized caspase-like protein